MYGYSTTRPKPRAYHTIIKEADKIISHDLPQQQATSPYLNRPRRDMLEALFDYSAHTYTAGLSPSERMRRQSLSLRLAAYVEAREQREQDNLAISRMELVQFVGWIAFGAILGLIGCLWVANHYGVPHGY